MGQKTNPLFIRQKILRHWGNLWYTKHNYPFILHQDLFIKRYIKHQLRLIKLELLNIIIKRTIKGIFINIIVFNWNRAKSLKFKALQPISRWWFPSLAFRLLSSRLATAIFKLTKLTNVRFKVNIIQDSKTAVYYLLTLAHPSLLANYVMGRQNRMFSAKRTLKILRAVSKKIPLANTLLRGLTLRVAGPLKAPRNRRAQVLKQTIFGTVPLQTFVTNILYAVASRSLHEGLVTVKIWMRKDMIAPKLLVRNILLKALQNVTKIRKFLVKLKYKYLTMLRVRRKRRKIIKYQQPFIFWVKLALDKLRYKNMFTTFKKPVIKIERDVYRKFKAHWFRRRNFNNIISPYVTYLDKLLPPPPPPKPKLRPKRPILVDMGQVITGPITYLTNWLRSLPWTGKSRRRGWRNRKTHLT